MENGRLKIIIAAGGTGGHIFPALAVGEQLQQNSKNVELKFIAGQKEVDRRLYARPGVSVIKIAAAPVRKGMLRKISAIITNFWAFFQVLGILIREKPDGILAMGGYVTAPVIIAAAILAIPVIIHEQNSIPGRTNRLLAPLACKVLCSYEKTKAMITGSALCKFWARQSENKCLNLGNPVRELVLRSEDHEKALKCFNLKHDDLSCPRGQVSRTILISGGSQGAKYFNFQVLAILNRLDELWQGDQLHVLWSAGLLNYEEIKKAVAEIKWKQMTFTLVPFIEEMGLAYAAADFVIGRAGAIALAEIAARGLPSLLIPFPYAVDRHQYHNAQELAQTGAAILVEEKEINPEALAPRLNQLLKDEEKLKLMAQAARSVARPRAAEKIANHIISEFSKFVAEGEVVR